MKDESKPETYIKVLLNPVLTKIDVQTGDIIVAVGITIEFTAKSETNMTSVSRVVIPSFVLNQTTGDSASSAGSSLIPVKKKDEDLDTDTPMDL